MSRQGSSGERNSSSEVQPCSFLLVACSSKTCFHAPYSATACSMTNVTMARPPKVNLFSYRKKYTGGRGVVKGQIARVPRGRRVRGVERADGPQPHGARRARRGAARAPPPLGPGVRRAHHAL